MVDTRLLSVTQSTIRVSCGHCEQSHVGATMAACECDSRSYPGNCGDQHSTDACSSDRDHVGHPTESKQVWVQVTCDKHTDSMAILKPGAVSPPFSRPATKL